MTTRGLAQQAERTVGLWLLFLLASSICTVTASRPHFQYEQLQASQQRKAAAAVRHITQEVAGSLRRQLQQGANALCPEGCVDGYCTQAATQGGLRCQKCSNNLIVNKVDGTCGCPAGKYAVAGSMTCADCPKGSWCAGGKYSAAAPPPKVDCPAGMTTLGLRSTSARSCVNLPGYSYAISAGGDPSAAACPINTYGPGLKKQRACVPCPTGFVTDGKTGMRSPTACVVPAGYYLKGPGQAAPCPKGEWKAGVGANGNCTKCAFGVTTENEASTSELNCTVVLPGYYAQQMTGLIVTGVAVCPQKFYCAGGRPAWPFDPLRPDWIAPVDPTIKPCPDGMWTQNVGATSLEQCLTPPGFKTTNGATVQCGPNEFRADWKPAGEATTCSSCGTGVYALQTDTVTVYDIVNATESQIFVTTTADDCFILPGMGLMYNTLDKSWRAVSCDSNNYGMSNNTFGLSPQPCKPCPMNMISSKDNSTYPSSARWFHTNDDGTGGFINPYACVNQAGYGYNGRVSQKCDKGYWNTKDSYSTCKPCGSGLTTAGPGLGKKETDCGIAPGHGFGLIEYFNTSIAICPVGTYNDQIQYNRKTPCMQCPNGTTTTMEGASDVSDCNLCSPGWGGPKCATPCGGVGAAASYGPPGRDIGTPCVSCNQQLTYYSYNWMNNNDVWAAPVVSRQYADSPGDCLAQFVQAVDSAFYLPLQDWAGVTTTPNISSFSDCVALCQQDCQLVTYDYRTLECFTRVVAQVVYDGAPYVAFKGVAAGVVTTSSVRSNSSSPAAPARKDNSTARAKKKDYGQYTIWWDPNANSIGRQVDAAGAAGFDRMQNCLDACDFDTRCVGVTVQNVVHPGAPYNNAGPKTCKLIYGDTRPGIFKRTVVRADPTRVEIPVYMRVCRDEPPPVKRGNWPISCRGTPVGGSCVAFCDCNPDECYARDGCPTTICQEDGTWGPFTPPECALAIPAQPQIISCPTAMRPGLYASRRRSLLDSRSSSRSSSSGVKPRKAQPLPPEEAARALAAVRKKIATSTSARADRSLLWAPPSTSFTALWSQVKAMCPVLVVTPPYQELVFPGDSEQFGQSVTENGICDQRPTGQITGVAAQDFWKFGVARNKYENQFKVFYESYVWSRFAIPGLPDTEALIAQLQGMQLMIVGNVGTDHPCQAVCSVTAIDLAFYTDDNGAPGVPLYSALINLNYQDPTMTFQWSSNETAVLAFDVGEYSSAILIADQKYYWVRLKLQVPFNGTDGSGNARCYAYAALKGWAQNDTYPALWQEAGGYSTSCKGIPDEVIPGPTQTVGNCSNAGGPGLTTLDACTAAIGNNTCAPVKYGADVPRSCPFPATRDIVFSLFGFNSAKDLLATGAGGA